MLTGYGAGTIGQRLDYDGEFQLSESKHGNREVEPKFTTFGVQIGCLYVSYQAFDKLVELRKEHRGN